MGEDSGINSPIPIPLRPITLLWSSNTYSRLRTDFTSKGKHRQAPAQSDSAHHFLPAADMFLWQLLTDATPKDNRRVFVHHNLPLPTPVSTFRSEEFLTGPSGSLMSCRLGMLITMRRLALRSALIRLEAIFSIVSLLGVRNIKSNLRKIKITHN